jgi:2'-5' RNA ligase
MYAIATLLSQDVARPGLKLEQVFDHIYKVAHVIPPNLLHVSWFVTPELNMQGLEDEMNSLVKNWKSFSFKTKGLGLFNQKPIVIYLPIIRTLEITKMHGAIWDLLTPHTRQAVQNYSPERWIPHITIGYGEITNTRIASAFSQLVSEPLIFNSSMENISLIYNIDGDSGVTFRAPLSGPGGTS